MSRFKSRQFWDTVFWRLVILVVVLAGWQYLPKVDAVTQHVKWMNPFFISSPERVYHEITYLMTGSHGLPSVWPYLWITFKATVIGAGIGIAIGAFLGAFLSNNERLARIFSLYITILNAMPRVALIPIVVIIVGTGVWASVVSSAIVVSFLTFFNAFEGGRSVPRVMLQNAQVLRASHWQVMAKIRFPHVMIWVFAAIPNALAFALVSTVTTELLTGTAGMGGLMLTATANVNSALSFAVMILLSALGIVLVAVADRVKRMVLHWQS
jgi:NitT/TauT family transport system permease protein